MAKLYLKDKNKLEPNETCLCEVKFSEPMCGVFGDKCILRNFSPLQTIAGASIINPLPHFPKLREIPDPENLLSLEQDFLDENTRNNALYEQLKCGNKTGISLRRLTLLCNLDEKDLDKALQQLTAQKRCISYDKENKTYLAAPYALEHEQAMLEILQKYHQNEPLKQYMPKASLLSHFEQPKLAHYVLETLIKQKRIAVFEDGVCLAEHNIALKSHEHTLKTNLYDDFMQNPQNPPLLRELIEKYSVPQKELLDVLALLIQEHKLIKIKEGMYFLSTELAEIKNNILQFFKNNQDMSPGDFKELSKGLTRKYAIPVLEYFDKERMTIRVGDVRRLGDD